MGVDEKDDLRFVSLRDVYATRGATRKGGANVGVLFAEGEINVEVADSPLNAKKVVSDRLADRILKVAATSLSSFGTQSIRLAKTSQSSSLWETTQLRAVTICLRALATSLPSPRR